MHEYFAENHEWDLTLRASHDLLMLGQKMKLMGGNGTLESGFSCFTGSMLLACAAIESFSASVAFLMPSKENFAEFDFEDYRKKRGFWERIEMLCASCEVEVDRSSGLFQHIAQLYRWRNTVSHASPYRIDPTSIANTTGEPRKVHRPYVSKQFAREVTVENAKQAYTAAFDYIKLIKTRTSIEPRTFVSYKKGPSDKIT